MATNQDKYLDYNGLIHYNRLLQERFNSKLSAKQDALVAGTNITIVNNVISAVLTDDGAIPEINEDSISNLFSIEGSGGNTTESDSSELTLGETYKLANYNWVVAETFDDYVVLQASSPVVTNCAWAGYVKNNNSYYRSNIYGEDISELYPATKNLYYKLKNIEHKDSAFGSGLYLIDKSMITSSTSYATALRAIHNAFRQTYERDCEMWLGNFYYDDSSYSNSITTSKYAVIYHAVFGGLGAGTALQDSTNDKIVAPAFNLDVSKVYLDGDEIKIK